MPVQIRVEGSTKNNFKKNLTAIKHYGISVVQMIPYSRKEHCIYINLKDLPAEVTDLVVEIKETEASEQIVQKAV